MESATKKPRLDTDAAVEDQATALVMAEIYTRFSNGQFCDVTTFVDFVYAHLLSPEDRKAISLWDFTMTEAVLKIALFFVSPDQFFAIGRGLWTLLPTEVQVYWRAQAKAGKTTPEQRVEHALEFVTDFEEKRRLLGDYPDCLLKLPKCLLQDVLDGLGIHAIQDKYKADVALKTVMDKWMTSTDFWVALGHRDIRKPLEEGLQELKTLLSYRSEEELGGAKNRKYLLDLYHVTLPHILKSLDEVFSKGLFIQSSYVGYFTVGAYEMAQAIIDALTGVQRSGDEYLWNCFASDDVITAALDNKGLKLSFYLDPDETTTWRTAVYGPKPQEALTGIDAVDLTLNGLELMAPSDIAAAMDRIATTWVPALDRTMIGIRSPAEFTLTIHAPRNKDFKLADCGDLDLAGPKRPKKIIIGVKTGFKPIFKYDTKKVAADATPRIIPLNQKPERAPDDEIFHFDHEVEEYYMGRIEELLNTLIFKGSDQEEEEENSDSSE